VRLRGGTGRELWERIVNFMDVFLTPVTGEVDKRSLTPEIHTCNFCMLRLELASYEGSSRYLWKVIHYLQRDAARKGVMRKGAKFGSFWNNLSVITDAALSDKLWVALNTRNQIVGYMVVGRRMGSDFQESGIMPLDIFEVMEKFRNKGHGTCMVALVKEQAASTGYCGIRVRPANNSTGFWESMGFSGENNELLCPLG